MKVLAVADVESRYYYDYYTPGKLDEFDLIISCGDLNHNYLEFLQTLGNVPVLYVRGNHDDGYAQEPPEGCTCIEDRIFVYQGVRFLGLGGSYKYRNGENMFTEREMCRRIKRLFLSLWYHRGFDVLVTHAPARHLNDFDSLSHRGFECFLKLLDRYRPAYFIHGHIHKNYGIKIPQKSQYGDTLVINAYEHCSFEIEEKTEKKTKKEKEA